jgi:septal ring factor EnvC (AmiA/AmiB activator)
VAKAPPRKPAPSKKPAARKTVKRTQPELVQRQRAELQDPLRQVEADYDQAENDHRAEESELDANEHHIADSRPPSNAPPTSSNKPAANSARHNAGPASWNGH